TMESPAHEAMRELRGLMEPYDGVAFQTVSNYSEKVILRYPGMNHGGYASGYAALYDITPDWHAILDEMPNVSGLFLAAGSSGHGFKLAPAVGEMMAELIINGKKDGEDIDFFSFARFAENRLITGNYSHSIVG
ncbi:MAG: FAD-dependent oxidoreductase, partial [Deltaproteobacteria bacterium]|nr:FAD-dependent oxidoreductase [Deltaproteobacteria bacterium]